jgi:hypothetical protein
MTRRNRSFKFSDGESYLFEVVKCWDEEKVVAKVIVIGGIGEINYYFKSVKLYVYNDHCYLMGKLFEPDFAEGFYNSPTYSNALIYYTNKAATEEYYFNDDEEDDEVCELNRDFFKKYKKEGIQITLCNEVLKVGDDKFVFIAYEDEDVSRPVLQQLTLGTGKLPEPVKSII